MATPPGHGAAETLKSQKYSTQQCLNTTLQTPAQEYSETDDVLTKLTRSALKKEWETAVTLLKQLQYCDEQCDWAIEEVVMEAPLGVVSSLTWTRCSIDRFDTVLTHLMTRNLWDFVINVLRRGLRDVKYREAVHNSIGQVSDEGFTIYVLGFCSEDNLELLLTRLVKQRVWRTLDILLQRDIGDSLRRLAIEVCSKALTSDDFLKHVLCYCRADEVNVVITNLVKQGELKAAGELLRRGVSDELLTWVVEECMRQQHHGFIRNVLPYCAKHHVHYALKQYVESGVWSAVGVLLRRDVPVPLHKHAVEEASKRAGDVEFSKYIRRHCRDDERDCVLTILVKRRQWMSANEVLQQGVSISARVKAIQEASKRAPSEDLIQYILPHCPDDQLGSVLEILVERDLWEAVENVFPRCASVTHSRGTIQKAMDEENAGKFSKYICPYCTTDQSDFALTLLVTIHQWLTMEKVLKRGVTDTHRRQAVEECSQRATGDDFTQYALPYCSKDQLDSVLKHLVTRGLWDAAEKVLKQGVSEVCQRWAVEEYSQRATGDEFTQYALPYCSKDQLDSVLENLVTRGLWDAAEKVLKQGVSEVCQRWAVKEYSQRATGDEFTQYALPYCSKDQLDSVLKHIVTRGLWKATEKVLQQGVTVDCQRWAVEECSQRGTCYECIQYGLPYCLKDQVDCVLTHLVTRDLWEAAEKVLQQGVTADCQRWAVEEYSKRATANDIKRYALPYCCKDQLDVVLENLVRRNFWEVAGQVLQQGVSDRCQRWAVEEYSKRATGDDFTRYALPCCCKDQLDSVLENLVRRKLWKAADKVLQQGVSDSCRRCAVEEFSQRASGSDFIHYAVPYCAENDLDSVLSNLVKRCEWEAAHKLLCQCKPCTQSQNGMEDIPGMEKNEFYKCILPCHYVHILPFLVEHKYSDLISNVLHAIVCETLCTWTKLRKHSLYVDTFWTIVENSRVSAERAIYLFALMKGDTASGINKVTERLGLKRELCELLYTSLLHNVCVELCSASRNPTVLTEPVKSCVLDIYTKITTCMRNRSVEQSVQDKIADFESTREDVVKFWELNKSISRPVQLFFHFLEQFNVYYANRRGDHDDDVLLMMFAVLPLFPELQSVALKIMLSHKRWDVLSHACLSRVWEQDRRHLLQAAVKQRQWSVVKQWVVHTLYDDQRVWALDEALREKQWEVALLLADHGLTTTELMRVRYRLAKYADWDTVLHMFERGADVEEISERLGRMNEDKKMNSSLKLDIRQRYIHALGLERNMQARCRSDLEKACQKRQWAFVLYCLIRNPMKNYVRLALKAAIKTKTWHVVMQLVRLTTDTTQRDSLFSRMMKRRQWGVCRALLEQRLSIKVCLNALPQLMEMNQWTLVAR